MAIVEMIIRFTMGEMSWQTRILPIGTSEEVIIIVLSLNKVFPRDGQMFMENGWMGCGLIFHLTPAMVIITLLWKLTKTIIFKKNTKTITTPLYP